MRCTSGCLRALLFLPCGGQGAVEAPVYVWGEQSSEVRWGEVPMQWGEAGWGWGSAALGLQRRLPPSMSLLSS